MAPDADISELKRMCVLLFLELRRLDIEPTGLRDSDEYQKSVGGYMQQLDSKMRHLIKEYPHFDQ